MVSRHFPVPLTPRVNATLVVLAAVLTVNYADGASSGRSSTITGRCSSRQH